MTKEELRKLWDAKESAFTKWSKLYDHRNDTRTPDEKFAFEVELRKANVAMSVAANTFDDAVGKVPA